MFLHIFKKYKLLILPSALYSLRWVTHLYKDNSLNSCVGQGPSLPAATAPEQILDTSLAWGKALQVSPAHWSLAIHFTASLLGVGIGKLICRVKKKKLSGRGLKKSSWASPWQLTSSCHLITALCCSTQVCQGTSATALCFCLGLFLPCERWGKDLARECQKQAW